jgi:hypothetical protein
MAYCSDPAPGTDLTDPDDTRALVRAFVLPGILALRLEPSGRSVSIPPNHVANPPIRPTPSNHQRGRAQ